MERIATARMRELATYAVIARYRMKGITVGPDIKRQVGVIAHQLGISPIVAREFVMYFVRLLAREVFMSKAEVAARDFASAPRQERMADREEGLMSMSEEAFGDACISHLFAVVPLDNFRLGSETRQEIMAQAKIFGVDEDEFLAFYQYLLGRSIAQQNPPME